MTPHPSDLSPGGTIWIVRFSDADQRQLTTAELIRAFEAKQVSAYTMVSREGMGWTQIGNVPHLVMAISTVVKRRNSQRPQSTPTPVPVSAPKAARVPSFDHGPSVVVQGSAQDPEVAVPLISRSTPPPMFPRQSPTAAQPAVVTPLSPPVSSFANAAHTPSVEPFTVPPGRAATPASIRKSGWSARRLALTGATLGALSFAAAVRFGALPSLRMPWAKEAPAALTPSDSSSPSTALRLPDRGSTSSAGLTPPSTAANHLAPTEQGVLSIESLTVAEVKAGRSAYASQGRLREPAPGAAAPLEDAPSAASPEVASDNIPTAEAPPVVVPSSLDGPITTPLPTAEPAKPAEASGPPGEFDSFAARAALALASQRAKSCLGLGLVHGTGKVVVVFEPDGRAGAVNILDPEFAQPPLGPCLVGAFKQARVPAFVGAPTAVSKTFTAN